MQHFHFWLSREDHRIAEKKKGLRMGLPSPLIQLARPGLFLCGLNIEAEQREYTGNGIRIQVKKFEIQRHLDFTPPFSYNPMRSCEPVFLSLSINP